MIHDESGFSAGARVGKVRLHPVFKQLFDSNHMAMQIVTVAEPLMQFLATETPAGRNAWYESMKLQMILQLEELVALAQTTLAENQKALTTRDRESLNSPTKRLLPLFFRERFEDQFGVCPQAGHEGYQCRSGGITSAGGVKPNGPKGK